MRKRALALPILAVSAISGYSYFNIDSRTVTGRSMEPAIHERDMVYTESFPFFRSRLHRGDFAVARDPQGGIVVKSVAATPGEKVLYNGRVLTLGEGEFFLLGFSPYSIDSNDYGPLTSLEGRVFYSSCSHREARASEAKGQEASSDQEQ